MSRESGQQYKMQDGSLRVLCCATVNVPDGAVLWNGYDYIKQQWVEEGVLRPKYDGSN